MFLSPRLPESRPSVRLLVLRPTLFPAPVAAAHRQNGAGKQTHGEHAEIDQRGGSMNRGLFRHTRNGETKIDLMRIVHAHIEHDKEDDEERDGFDDGFQHGWKY